MTDDRQLRNRRIDDLATRANGNHEFLRVTFRDAVAPVFRQRRLASMIFLGIFLGALLSGLLMPRKYEAEMKILVNRDRVDAAVTPNPDLPVVAGQVPPVTEEDMNSEVELLKSRDLLEQVVIARGLNAENGPAWARKIEGWIDTLRGAKSTQATALARAVQTLDNRLVVDPLKKTTIIRVTYASRDPELSARVLKTLASLYEEKHAAVHRPPGTFSFFDLETEHYRNDLAAYQARLTDFSERKGLLDAPTQKQLVLQQLSQFQSEVDQDRADAYSAQERALKLKQQQNASPERQTTVVRKIDNGELLAQLHSTLLSLELKRSDMLTKYAPDYPPVLELQSQIADAKAAIAEAVRAPIEEVTTDRTPAQDWMATELSKAETDRAALEAKAVATARVVHRYQGVAQQLDSDSAAQDDLIRNVKTAEENYLLYLRKREEARISDALDRDRIVNVSLAEAATVPALPTLHLGWLLVAGLFAAGTASVGAAYAIDRIDPSFRTPDELGRCLDLRVLASIPASTERQ
jgi:uncharacterized protein involved in exopolysaccharide biosynthesis